MPETYKYLGKTRFYLKEAEDGFYYLGFIDVYAVNEKYLFDSTFTKKINIDSTFGNYEEATQYMKRMGIELYMDSKKTGFKKIAAVGSDVIE